MSKGYFISLADKIICGGEALDSDATGNIRGVLCVATVIGPGAWVGTTLGGMGGEYIGEKIYEAKQP